MLNDANDPRTNRGGKLFKDKNAVRAQAKVWVICLALAIIFFVSMNVNSREASAPCDDHESSCNCLATFHLVYACYLLVILLYTACKVKLSCKASQVYASRRDLKLHGRKLDLSYSFMFVILFTCLLATFLKDNKREEC